MSARPFLVLLVFLHLPFTPGHDDALRFLLFILLRARIVLVA